MSYTAPVLKFPLDDQNDYKARVYFTVLIEEVPSIDTSAFVRESEDIGVLGAFQNLGDVLLQESPAAKDIKVKQLNYIYLLLSKYKMA